MKYTSLLDDIDKAFSSFRKPSKIHTAPENNSITKGEYLAIQHNFGGILREKITDKQCSMILVDGSLISDEALCYFLTRLVTAVFPERGNEYLLYRRLEHLDRNLLSQEQKKMLDCLITSLKELEKK